MKKTFIALSTTALLLSSLHAETAYKTELQQLRQDVDILKAENQQMKSEFEDNSKSGFQLAGYASFDYANTENGDNAFSGAKFAPIFHYKYGDIFQFEGELEFTVNSDGETDVEMEYAAGTLFINDYMGLQMGKFMSPVGQFVQNQHPSWINKLPSTPVGFGHDGAAPTSNLGLALRGGLPAMGKIRSNYVIFVSNAPTFSIKPDGDIGITAEGTTTSNDAAKTIGGRFAVNPVGGMEIGISASTGEIADLINPDNTLFRDYDVFGADMMYNYMSFDFKAEYIQQKIGDNSASTFEGGTWKAWYTQLSYQFSSFNVEPVIRYSDYQNPDLNRDQWAFGLNYLFANNLIAKLAYEYNTDKNDANADTAANNDRVLAQFAFGF
ncbi:MAG TPA: porin [Epsilonproteobacteria bacterium]|nr:porin [Campylobacterota bacterium]